MEDKIANKIRLKPRFSFTIARALEEVKSIVEAKVKHTSNQFRTKLIDDHLVIDVLKNEEHFWSPQLQIELVAKNEGTLVKGLFGPKPQLWTFFMMIHFAMAILFAVFAVLCYSQFSLGKNYTLSLVICISILVLWMLFYVLGQFGKKRGHDQMAAMHDFVMDIVGD